MKYRKKPVVVEAWKFDGGLESSKALPYEIRNDFKNFRLTQNAKLRIKTREGYLLADVGDYIIRGNSVEYGYHYLVNKPDYFKKTYEQIEE